jgi:hypothetical protein
MPRRRAPARHARRHHAAAVLPVAVLGPVRCSPSCPGRLALARAHHTTGRGTARSRTPRGAGYLTEPRQHLLCRPRATTSQAAPLCLAMARIPAAFLSPREREGALPCGEEDQRESDGGERRETDKDLGPV